jgi:hypothetical protein
MTGGPLHGPYFYHFVREGGKLKKRYIEGEHVAQTTSYLEQSKALAREEKQFQEKRRHRATDFLTIIADDLRALDRFFQSH